MILCVTNNPTLTFLDYRTITFTPLHTIQLALSQLYIHLISTLYFDPRVSPLPEGSTHINTQQQIDPGLFFPDAKETHLLRF